MRVGAGNARGDENGATVGSAGNAMTATIPPERGAKCHGAA